MDKQLVALMVASFLSLLLSDMSIKLLKKLMIEEMKESLNKKGASKKYKKRKWKYLFLRFFLNFTGMVLPLILFIYTLFRSIYN